MSGKIYIASMNMRGKCAEPIDKNSKNLNVTSAQSKTSKNRRDFSPMTEIVGRYKGFWNFESYWQPGKVFESIPEEKTKKWWKELEQPKRIYPKSKGIKVLYSTWNGTEKFDYVNSRKKVYVPEYYQLIKDKEMLKYWKEQYEKGQSITIYDFDGPRLHYGSVSCLEVTKDVLIEKINDTQFPFGHGYVVAASILGICISEYCN